MKFARQFTAAASALLIVSGCTDETSKQSADWMVFQSDEASIVLVRTDGTGKFSPTDDVPGLDQTNPDWSPDGTRLVFAVADGTTDDLWTVGVDGTSAELLLACEAPCVYFDDPAWSPDGTKVMYSRSADDGKGNSVATLETVSVADGTVEVVLTAAPDEFFSGVRWSPDGKSAVFERVHMTGTALDSDVDAVTLTVIDMAAPETSQRGITDPALFGVTADWSPDGERIVFSALSDPDAAAADLFTIAPDGTGLTQITTLADDGGGAEEPAWSVDGSQIYFKRVMADGSIGLAKVSTNGGEVSPAFGDTYLAGRHPRLHDA